jgi:hypothetical protein
LLMLLTIVMVSILFDARWCIWNLFCWCLQCLPRDLVDYILWSLLEAFRHSVMSRLLLQVGCVQYSDLLFWYRVTILVTTCWSILHVSIDLLHSVIPLLLMLLLRLVFVCILEFWRWPFWPCSLEVTGKILMTDCDGEGLLLVLTFCYCEYRIPLMQWLLSDTILLFIYNYSLMMFIVGNLVFCYIILHLFVVHLLTFTHFIYSWWF